MVTVANLTNFVRDSFSPMDRVLSIKRDKRSFSFTLYEHCYSTSMLTNFGSIRLLYSRSHQPLFPVTFPIINDRWSILYANKLMCNNLPRGN